MNVTVSSKATPAPNLDKQTFQMVYSGLPLKTKAYCVVQAFEYGRKEYIDYMGYQQYKIINYRNVKIDPNLIAADSLQGTRMILQRLGLRLEHLPRCLGGTYDYNQFQEWTRMRLSVEDIMSSTPFFANHLPNWNTTSTTESALANISKKRRRCNIDSYKEEKEDEGHYPTLSQTKASRTRQHNASKTRRCCHRRELHLFALQEQSRAFVKRNSELRRDNARIENLLLQARARIAEKSN